MMFDISDRHPAGIERDDHPVQPPEAPRALRHQRRGERPVPVPRDLQLDIANLRGNLLRERPVARVRVKRRLRITLLIADMLSQLGLQTPLQASLDQLLNEAIFAIKLDLARIDLGKQVIKRTRLPKPVSTLSLLTPPPLASIPVDHGHQCRPSIRSRHPLHKRSDTLALVSLPLLGALGSIIRKIQTAISAV